jgi:hypothetical protein
MSAEQYKEHHEKSQDKELDKDLLKERDRKLEEQIHDAEKSKESHSDKSLEKIRESIEHTAKSNSEKLPTDLDEDKKHVPAPKLDKATKNTAYKREMTRIQKKLSAPERTLSKFIHNPVVDKVNEVGAKTIARPSGLLGGGIFAGLGTLIFYIMSRYYGFEYNFFLFILLLALGFLVGICVELIVYPLIKHNKYQ